VAYALQHNARGCAVALHPGSARLSLPGASQLQLHGTVRLSAYCKLFVPGRLRTLPPVIAAAWAGASVWRVQERLGSSSSSGPWSRALPSSLEGDALQAWRATAAGSSRLDVVRVCQTAAAAVAAGKAVKCSSMGFKLRHQVGAGVLGSSVFVLPCSRGATVATGKGTDLWHKLCGTLHVLQFVCFSHTYLQWQWYA
jgi:hypothetical protein